MRALALVGAMFVGAILGIVLGALLGITIARVFIYAVHTLIGWI